MEKSKKVMNIVVNILAFVAIALFIVGMFALPPISLSAGAGSESTSAYNIIDQMIDVIKQLGQTEGPGVGTLVGRLLSLLAFVVIFAVFAIMGLIKAIQLLVRSIKSISKPEENKPALKNLVYFGIMCLIYDTLVLAIFYSSMDYGLGSVTVSLGAGTIMILIAGLLALCGAACYNFITRKEEPLMNRILDVCTSVFGIVAIMLMLFAPIGLEGSKGGVIALLAGRFGSAISAAIAGTQADYLVLSMTIVGSVLLFVSLGFAKKVIANGYRLEEKEGLDYPKSSIVKSSLWLGFSVVGVVLLFAFSSGYSIAIGGIMTFVFVALALGCAIANKVMSSKAAPKAE